ESYIHDLVTNDFLISDLRPPICNINSLDYLLSKLEEGTLCTDLTTLKKMIEVYIKKYLLVKKIYSISLERLIRYLKILF
ncbi:hypothetical protein AB7996_08655, partial [Streptococcus pyogenes]